MTMDIRPEQPADAAAIRAVTRAAFETAPHSGGNEADIVEVLRASGALTLSLVAVHREQVGRHVAFSPVEAVVLTLAAGAALAQSPRVDTRQGAVEPGVYLSETLPEAVAMTDQQFEAEHRCAFWARVRPG